MVSVPMVPVATVAAAVPPAILAHRVWHDRGEPGARPFAVTLGVVVAFDLLYAVSMLVADQALGAGLLVILSHLVLLTSLTWLLFALEYTGRVGIVSRRLVGAILALPVVGLLVYSIPATSPLLLAEYDVVQHAGVYVGTFTLGPVGGILMLLGFLAMVVGMVLLAGFVISDRHRYGLQAGVFLVIASLHHLAVLDRVLELSPLYPINITPLAWAVGSLFGLYALDRWDLFGFAPAVLRVGQAAAFDDLRDALFIVDEGGRLVDANTRATELIDRQLASALQQPVEEVLGAEIDLAEQSQTVALETTHGRRDYRVAASAVDGSWGETIGYTLLLHDVTQEKQRRQRFQVLNRILRHNLRNGMNAVAGFSRELQSDLGPSDVWMLERIQQQSTKLVELSEKARDIDRVTDPSGPPRAVPVRATMARVAEQLRSDRRTLTVDAPADLAVTTSEPVFESVLQYAAESLLRYTDVSEPRLTLTGRSREDGEGITCRLTTNGSPIPESERQVIERGEETPLDHSHDLDLWLVSWGVDTLGGELEFLVDADRPGLALTVPELQEDLVGARGDGDPPDAGAERRELDRIDHRLRSSN